MNLIDKWIAMQAVQGIDSVATLRDGDPVIRMSDVEHVLENLPEAPDINVGNMDAISRQQAIDTLIELTANGTNKGMVFGEDAVHRIEMLPSAEPEQTEMIKEIRKWINSGNRGSADYFIVDKIEEIINAYEIN